MGYSLRWMEKADIPAGMVQAVEHVKVEKAAEMFHDCFVNLREWAEARRAEWSGFGAFERVELPGMAARRYQAGELVTLYTDRFVPDPYVESCWRFYRENMPRSKEEREMLTDFFLSNKFSCPF